MERSGPVGVPVMSAVSPDLQARWNPWSRPSARPPWLAHSSSQLHAPAHPAYDQQTNLHTLERLRVEQTSA